MDAITNLSIATASDRSAITELTDTVAKITTELATVNSKLVVALQAKCASRGGRGGRDRTTCGQGSVSGQGAVTGDGAAPPSKNQRHCTHNVGVKIPGASNKLLLYVRPWMQAHLHGNQESYAGRGGSTAVKRKGRISC